MSLPRVPQRMAVVVAAFGGLGFALSALAATVGALVGADATARSIGSDEQHRPQLEATMPGASVVIDTFLDRMPVCPAELGRIEQGLHVS